MGARVAALPAPLVMAAGGPDAVGGGALPELLLPVGRHRQPHLIKHFKELRLPMNVFTVFRLGLRRPLVGEVPPLPNDPQCSSVGGLEGPVDVPPLNTHGMG